VSACSTATQPYCDDPTPNPHDDHDTRTSDWVLHVEACPSHTASNVFVGEPYPSIVGGHNGMTTTYGCYSFNSVLNASSQVGLLGKSNRFSSADGACSRDVTISPRDQERRRSAHNRSPLGGVVSGDADAIRAAKVLQLVGGKEQYMKIMKELYSGLGK
jgi:hypothetical protein